MTIYILNVLTVPVYWHFIKNRKVFVAVVAIQMFLILALKSTMLGVDMDNYSGGYEYISQLDFGDMISRLDWDGMTNLTWFYRYENGYIVFNWLASHLGWSFHFFLAVCAAINVGGVSYFIYKYSKKPWLSFMIICTFGFYTSMFGIIRQSLALSLILITFCLLEKRRKRNYIVALICLLLAISFHRTSLIVLPLLLIYAFYPRNISKKNFIRLLAIAVPLLIFSGFIYENVVTLIMGWMGKGYVGHELIFNRRIFLYSGIALFMIFRYDFSKIRERIDSASCFALIFAIYCSIFVLYNDKLGRAMQFYTIFLILLVPNMLAQLNSRRSVFAIEAALCVALIIYMCINISGSAIDPYMLEVEWLYE